MNDSRTRVWFALFVLAVFCGGLAAGLLVGTRLARPEPRFADPAPPRGGFMRPSAPLLANRLAEELELTAGQRAQLEEVLSRRRPRVQQMHRDVRRRFAREQRELRGEIRAILTPEQQARFDRWVKETRHRTREPGTRTREPGN